MADPGYIDGVYNYCDHWCQRCPLTLRCRVFAAEQADAAPLESRDPQNAAFWSGLQNAIAQAKDLIVRLARDRGMDLDMIDLSEGKLSARSTCDVREHPLALTSQEYAVSASHWLHANASLLEEQLSEVATLANIGVATTAFEDATLETMDAIDVIGWYQLQINVKLCRALSSRQEATQTANVAMQHDADGSAKVALIGIDRSIAAWTALARSIPDEADLLLDLLVQLDRLRRAAEEEFPQARSFVRPGFDTP